MENNNESLRTKPYRESEFLIRMRLYQEAIDMAHAVKEPHLVLYSPLAKQFKVESSSNIYIDREAALNGEVVLLFVGFLTSFYTTDELKELIRSQLTHEVE